MTDLQFAKELVEDMNDFFKDKNNKKAHIIFNKAIKDFKVIKNELAKSNYSLTQKENKFIIKKEK